jgi:2-polyprenyl-6-methoxyphenol hydroxylase-like FAD-dependent oxidoreductase
MAPNTGQGANCAIEDAAALANALSMAINHDSHPSQATIHSLLESVNKTRLARVQEIYKSARLVVRLHARESLALRLVGRYYLPYSGDLPADTASKLIVGGEQLRFLAPSRRAGSRWDEYCRKSSRSYVGLLLTPGGAVLVLVLGLVGVWTFRLFNYL